MAPGAEAGLLALALRQRHYRRWHRLRAVGLTDDAPEEIYSADDWGALSVPVVRLPPREGLEAAREARKLSRRLGDSLLEA